MRRRLLRLWRRAVHCRRGEHRDAVGCAFGIMHLECVDCGWRQSLGFVFVGVSNRRRHEWDDAA